jgi:hypothetical protein
MFTYNGAQNLTLNTGTGVETINVESTAAGTNTTINENGAANDTMNVSPTAQNLNTIQGPLFFNGNAGNSVVNLRDDMNNANYFVGNNGMMVSNLPFMFQYNFLSTLDIFTNGVVFNNTNNGMVVEHNGVIIPPGGQGNPESGRHPGLDPWPSFNPGWAGALTSLDQAGQRFRVDTPALDFHKRPSPVDQVFADPLGETWL